MLANQKGFAQILATIGLAIVILTLPLAVKLVEQRQEVRKEAADSCANCEVYISQTCYRPQEICDTCYNTCYDTCYETCPSCTSYNYSANECEEWGTADCNPYDCNPHDCDPYQCNCQTNDVPYECGGCEPDPACNEPVGCGSGDCDTQGFNCEQDGGKCEGTKPDCSCNYPPGPTSTPGPTDEPVQGCTNPSGQSGDSRCDGSNLLTCVNRFGIYYWDGKTCPYGCQNSACQDAPQADALTPTPPGVTASPTPGPYSTPTPSPTPIAYEKIICEFSDRSECSQACWTICNYENGCFVCPEEITAAVTPTSSPTPTTSPSETLNPCQVYGSYAPECLDYINYLQREGKNVALEKGVRFIEQEGTSWSSGEIANIILTLEKYDPAYVKGLEFWKKLPTNSPFEGYMSVNRLGGSIISTAYNATITGNSSFYQSIIAHEIGHTLVTDEDVKQFRKEMGGYGVYWFSGGDFSWHSRITSEEDTGHWQGDFLETVDLLNNNLSNGLRYQPIRGNPFNQITNGNRLISSYQDSPAELLAEYMVSYYTPDLTPLWLPRATDPSQIIWPGEALSRLDERIRSRKQCDLLCQMEAIRSK